MRSLNSASPSAGGQTSPCLMMKNPGQPSSIFSLPEGGSIFAGSAASCGIQVTGENIAQYHCMFSLNQGRMWVQDCHTGGGVLVNGEAIESETVLNHGDVVTIGTYSFVANLGQGEGIAPDAPAPAQQAAAAVAAPPLPAESAPSSSPGDHDPSLDSETRDYLDRLILELDAETKQIATVVEEPLGFPSDLDRAVESETVSAPGVAPRAYATVDFQAEENELLREEIAHLQQEIAERDAELVRIRKSESAAPEESTLPEDENTLRLVQRLEELLDELQKSDGRILALEELLRVSEEAKRAEHDEREQLESWVGEIEQRIAQREAEVAAEVERLQAQNSQLQSQLKSNESQMRTMVQTVATPASLPQKAQEVVQGLRARCEELARRLQAADSELERLRTELKSQVQAKDEALHALEKKMVEQELEASRERAEIARNRAELERSRDELERGLRAGDLSEPDSRFAAMRQHLRELHDEEAQKRAERRQRSLGGRIASLLTRSSRG